MTSLTRFERCLLDAIASQYPTEELGLLSQFDAAMVLSRQNSGAGFFTVLAVDKTLAAPLRMQRVVGNVSAEIAGFENPMLGMLFMERGYAHTLEIAAIDDSTVGLDTGSILFQGAAIRNSVTQSSQNS